MVYAIKLFSCIGLFYKGLLLYWCMLLVSYVVLAYSIRVSYCIDFCYNVLILYWLFYKAVILY